MLTSVALILLLSLLVGVLFKKLKLPPLVGMIIVGILAGPNVTGLIDESILNISPEIRQAALVVILTRAGLSLKLSELKSVGRSAALLCFVPACFEMVGFILLSPHILGISYLEGAIIGSVAAAVSPAVIVPRMIKMIDERVGTEKGIPQMILAGASVDDVFVIVVFTVVTSFASTGDFSPLQIAIVPLSVGLGIAVGAAVGYCLALFFKKVHIRDTVKLMIIISVSFLLLEAESHTKKFLPFSALIAIMVVGMVIRHKSDALAVRLSSKYNKLWLFAEIMLFVLVGATVDLEYVKSAGIAPVIMIAAALIFRAVGVNLSLIKSKLNFKEKLFCTAAYMPKATVQAAIGAVPLSMGLACGNIVLTVAVLSILITAPLGAIIIDNTYKRVLK